MHFQENIINSENILLKKNFFWQLLHATGYVIICTHFKIAGIGSVNKTAWPITNLSASGTISSTVART